GGRCDELRPVEPDRRREVARRRCVPYEAVWVRGVGCGEDDAPLVEDAVSATVVNVVRRQHGDPGVPVLPVVPLEEALAEVARVLEATESIRKLRSILERLELRLRIRIVVRDVRPAMRLRDAEVREEEADRLR